MEPTPKPQLGIIKRLESSAIVRLCGILTQVAIIVSAVNYCLEIDDRKTTLKQQAWILLNSGQSELTDAGRVSAMEALAALSEPLDGVALQGAYLESLELTDTSLREASFFHVRFGKLVFRNCDLSGATFATAEGKTLEFIDCTMTNVNLSEVRVESLEIRGSQERAPCTEMNLNHISAAGAKFRNINLSWSSAIGAVLDDSKITEVRASDMDFEGASLEGSEIIDSKFRGAKFVGTTLTKAKITNTNLASIDWGNAIGLRDILGLEGSLIAGARNLPPGDYEVLISKGAEPNGEGGQ